MFLREWLGTKDYSENRGLCVTIGTDGLKHGRDNILSVSTCFLDSAPETVYIDGADCEKTSRWTGLDCGHYDEHKVGIERACEMLSERCAEAEYIVGYNVKDFLKPWLTTWFPELFANAEFLDIVSVVRAYDLGETLPPTADNIGTLYSRLNGFLVSSKGTSFKSICSRYLVGEDESLDQVELEALVLRLRNLYKTILIRG